MVVSRLLLERPLSLSTLVLSPRTNPSSLILPQAHSLYRPVPYLLHYQQIFPLTSSASRHLQYSVSPLRTSLSFLPHLPLAHTLCSLTFPFTLTTHRLGSAPVVSAASHEWQSMGCDRGSSSLTKTQSHTLLSIHVSTYLSFATSIKPCSTLFPLPSHYILHIYPFLL